MPYKCEGPDFESPAWTWWRTLVIPELGAASSETGGSLPLTGQPIMPNLFISDSVRDPQKVRWRAMEDTHIDLWPYIHVHTCACTLTYTHTQTKAIKYFSAVNILPGNSVITQCAVCRELSPELAL